MGVLAAVVGVVAAFLLARPTSAPARDRQRRRGGRRLVRGRGRHRSGGRRLRRQVARREAALEQSLKPLARRRDSMERVLDFSPHFYQGENLAEVAPAICDTAVATFGADGARVCTALGDDSIDILALCPDSDGVGPGSRSASEDFPDLESMLADHRPSFVRDLRETDLRGAGAAAPGRACRSSRPSAFPSSARRGRSDCWRSAGRTPSNEPADELMAIMQRFADQAAIAWQNALRLEAQRQADALHETLHRVVALAPSFHISGTKEQVARAICEAAVATFDCDRASLYRCEGDRLRVLDCVPPLESHPRGRTFPLSEDMPLVHEIRSRTPTFIPDVNDPSRRLRPWPAEVDPPSRHARSALYVPVRFNERGPQNLLVLSWNEPREQPDEQLPGHRRAVCRPGGPRAQQRRRPSACTPGSKPASSPPPPSITLFCRVVTRYRTGEQRLRLGGDFVGSTADAGRIAPVLRHRRRQRPRARRRRPGSDPPLDLEGPGACRREPAQDRLASCVRCSWPNGESPIAFATILVGHIDLQEHAAFLRQRRPPAPAARHRHGSLRSRPRLHPLGFDRGAATGRCITFPCRRRWSLFCYTDGLIDARVAPGASDGTARTG